MLRKKRKWGRLTARLLIALVLLFIIACFVFDQLVQFRMSDEELTEFFRTHNSNARIGYYTAHGRTLRYVSIGHDSLPTLVFIHGSPSSLSIYRAYFADTLITNRLKVYAVDRPGYGNSGFGKPEPSVQKQAAMIKPLLDSLRTSKKPVIVCGGSYGSTVACRLAMDYPHLVDGLVLTAPSLAPGEEKVFWFAPLIEHPLLNWFIPRMFRSANTEKLAHRRELEAMLPFWKNIRVPVIYMQGEKDELVYTTNADFAKKQLSSVPYLEVRFFPGRPHFIPFEERPAIRRKIIEMYHRVIALNRQPVKAVAP